MKTLLCVEGPESVLRDGVVGVGLVEIFPRSSAVDSDPLRLVFPIGAHTDAAIPVFKVLKVVRISLKRSLETCINGSTLSCSQTYKIANFGVEVAVSPFIPP